MVALVVLAVGCTARANSRANPSPEGLPNASPSASIDVGGDRLLVLRADGNLVTMGRDGDAVLQLTTDAGPAVVVRQPVASPNGRSLAWIEIRGSQASVVTVSRFGEHRVELPLQLAPFYLQWDPTSSRLVYLGNLGASIGLGVIDQAVVQPHDVPVGGGVPLYLSWAPSGTGLFVHVGADTLGRTDLTHPLRPVDDVPGTFQAPVWLPDGRVVYVARHGSHQRLVVTGTGGRAVLATVTGGALFEASPDGRRVAYRLDRPDGSQAGVFVQPTDGGRPVLVTTRETTAFFWSPDSRSLLLLTPDHATSSEPTHRWRVWDGHERFVSAPFEPSPRSFQEYLPFFDQYAQALTPWAPDSSAFAYAGFSHGQAGIWVQPIAADAAPTMVSDGDFVAWSPAAG